MTNFLKRIKKFNKNNDSDVFARIEEAKEKVYGKSFSFTGKTKIEDMKRKKLVSRTKNVGGKVHGKLIQSTDYFVVCGNRKDILADEEKQQKLLKFKKAKEYNTTIITDDEWYQWISVLETFKV